MRNVLPAAALLVLLLPACSSWDAPPDPGYRWEREYFDRETDLWVQVPIPAGELPVVEGGKIVGIVDESDLLAAAVHDESRLKLPVRDVMSHRLTTVPPNTAVRELLPLFNEGLVAIVMDGEHFLGIVTRIDVLNFLRRRIR